MSANNNDLNELIKRTYMTDVNGPLTSNKNCLLPLRFNKYANEIEEMEVYDTDIWVTSFPKSGTTWTQELVYLVANDCDFEMAKETIFSRFPFLELCTLFNFDNTVVPEEFIRSQSIKCVKNYKRTPRFIKTHLPWQLLPKSIQSKEKRPRIIHVIRNPKDICTSYYYHKVRLQLFNGTFEEFCKLFLADISTYAPYWENVLSYWKQRNEPNVLFLKYEDMKQDLKSVIKKVAKFLNKTVTEQQIKQLLIHLNFDSMKDNPAVNFKNRKNITNIDFMRKGIAGDYKNEMSPEIIKQFDEWIDNNNIGILF